MPSTAAESIPLSVAAQRLKVTWFRAWNLLLTGQLTGHKEGNRWMVDVESVERVSAGDPALTASSAA